MLNELGTTLYQRARQERGAARRPAREALLLEAEAVFQRVLVLDPENAVAHHNLGRVYAELEDDARATEHRALHAKYKIDDNARGVAIAAARLRYPAASHAAERIVIYDLQRPGGAASPQSLDPSADERSHGSPREVDTPDEDAVEPSQTVSPEPSA